MTLCLYEAEEWWQVTLLALIHLPPTCVYLRVRDLGTTFPCLPLTITNIGNYLLLIISLYQWGIVTMVSLALLAPVATGASLCAASLQLIENVDFPYPSITFDPQTSRWFAFATQGHGKNVQASTSAGLRGEWSLLTGVDLLPVPGKWVNPTRPDIWAPDVHQIKHTDTFVLYYSGLHADSPYHCIGIATSLNITGPYTAFHEPFACPLADGSAIDDSGFYDEENHSPLGRVQSRRQLEG
jgi:hypothetical protein